MTILDPISGNRITITLSGKPRRWRALEGPSDPIRAVEA